MLCLGLILGATLCLTVTSQESPQLYSDPPTSGLVEGQDWTLKCIFGTSPTIIGTLIVVGTAATPLGKEKVAVAALDADVVRKQIPEGSRSASGGGRVEFTMHPVPKRSLNNVVISCQQFLIGYVIKKTTKILEVKCQCQYYRLD